MPYYDFALKVQNLRLAMPALPTLRYGKAGKAGTDGHEIYQELNALTIWLIYYSKVNKTIRFINDCLS
jgi:hypothetical protein